MYTCRDDKTLQTFPLGLVLRLQTMHTSVQGQTGDKDGAMKTDGRLDIVHYKCM